MSVRACYNWTLEDLLTGRRITMRLNWRLHYFRAAMCILAALLLWRTHQSGMLFSASLFLIAFLIYLGLLLRRFLGEWTLRRQFPKRPDAGAEVGWDISEDGIVATTHYSRVELKWTAFQRAVATPAGIVFMPNCQVFHFLPARAFASPADMETVVEKASRLVPDFRRLK